MKRHTLGSGGNAAATLARKGSGNAGREPSASFLAKFQAGCILAWLGILTLQGCASTPAPVSESVQQTAQEAEVTDSTFLKPATIVTSGPPPAEEIVPEETDEGLGLILAARYGHENVVRILLNQGVDIDQQDDLGSTALIAVAGTPHTPILKLLLERGASLEPVTNDGTTALMNAAAMGRLDHVRMLLQAGAELDRRNEEGETALVYAIRFGQADVVDYLLEQGADPRLYSKEEVAALGRMTPLMYAAEYAGVLDGDPVIIRSLLKHGADPTLARGNGETALSIARRKGYSEIAGILERRGARDEGPYAGLSAEDALLKAIRLNDVDKVRELLETATDPNYRDPLTGITPLLAAAYHGNEEITRLLVKHGVEIDDVPWGLREERINASSVPVQERDLMRTAARGDTALITAIRRGHTPVALLLLKAGADPLQPNHLVETPGLFAARKGNAAVMRALLEEGLDPDLAQSTQLLDYFVANIVDEEKLRPLLIEAASNGHWETVTALLEAGADPDVRDEAGRTALYWAASQGFTRTVDVLLEYEADPNLRNEAGTTPLMVAARSGFRKVVTALLEHGADVNALENPGRELAGEGSDMTALAYAARGGHGEIVRLLLEHGADAQLRNSAGQTALDIALDNGYDEIAQLLNRQVAVSPF